MKNNRFMKSAISALLASVMLGTAMLPASAAETEAPEQLYEKNYYLEQLGPDRQNCKYIHILYSASDYKAAKEKLDAAYYDTESEQHDLWETFSSYNDMVLTVMKGIRTYRLEDSLRWTIEYSALAYYADFITEEDALNYIQTVAAGESLPDDVEDFLMSLEVAESITTIFTWNGGEKDWDEYCAYIESLRAQYPPTDADRKDIAATGWCYDFDWQKDATELSYNAANFENTFAKYLLTGSGDINSNSEADLTDAVLLARAIGGTYELSAASRREADLNGDLNVDQNDLNALLRVLAGA